MIDIFGKPQNLLVVGGTSEIAIQLVRELNSSERIKNLYLAGRDLNNLNLIKSRFESDSTKVMILELDHDHDQVKFIRQISDFELDMAILASGYLPDAYKQSDPDEVVKTFKRNFLGISEIGALLIDKFTRQKYGVLIIFSSIAALRPRPDNFVYGAAKAGLDSWARGAMYQLKNSGAKILLVRTGMVETRMSKHLKRAPMTISPEFLAKKIAKKIKGKKQILWVPSNIKYLGFLLKILPNNILVKLTSN